MSTLNKPSKTIESQNLAGGKAYERTNAKQELISIVLNSLNTNDLYYMDQCDYKYNLIDVLDKVNDLEFIAKLMVFARNEIGLRLVAKSLADYLMKNAKGQEFLSKAIYKSFVRPDDITDLMALSNCKNVNSFKRAAKKALEKKWDIYQLKKYSGSKLKVKLKDIVKLVHPSLKEYNKNFDNSLDVFKDIIEDKLPNIETAQTLNTSKVVYDIDKIQKLGYMAMVKNICNILENCSDVKECVEFICNRLLNKTQIKNSKILPFRFYDAFKSLSKLNIDEFYITYIRKTLVKAMTLSSENLNLKGKTALLLDESGSMDGRPFDYGKTLCASLMNENTLIYLWADDCRLVDNTDPYSFISNVECHGGGTDVKAPLEKLIQKQTFVDNIIILTDMQLYSDSWYNYTIDKYISEYRKINPDVKIVFWNLQPYGGASSVIFNKNVIEVCSCSDYIVSILSEIMQDKDYFIKLIENIDLTTY
nr:MAG TPA: ribonucleoprotein [Caudoviricetes sp.]